MMHPILEQMTLNEEQWPAVLARGRDVVVTAGAGTGKTRTLVARYLSLLADGLPLRSIVAITFTRKAAREMRNRIREEIRRYITLPGLSAEERTGWQRLYTELDAARIGTIHSLCAEILRAHPAEAEVDPQFEVLEEGLTALLRRRAVREAMAWAAGEPEVVRLFPFLGEGDLFETLDTLLGQRLEAERAFEVRCDKLEQEMAEAISLLRDLFAFACQQYDALKQERNGLDYDDLERKALMLLERHSDVRERWQREIRAILVDEFQDTNGRQRDLVQYLNGDGGKLFIVGDAKQSIYRFRGADVAVFRQERKKIEQAGGLVCSLETTYRAHQGLVEGLNALLRPVLGDVEKNEKPWWEPFAPIRASRTQPSPGFTSPYIELHLVVGTKSNGALDRAADAITIRLRKLVEEEQVQVEKEGELRPISYGDIVILCRASTSFSAYEDALERAGISYLTIAGRGFYERPEVRDLLNALQALADPTDNLAMAGLLRSPAFGLSDAALYRLWKAGKGLWEALGGCGAIPADEERQRAERARRIIEELHQQVGRISVAELLKAFLDRTAYRAAFLRAGQKRALHNVDKLLEDAQTSGMVGVGEFLEYIQGLRDVGVREGEARAEAEGAVQIMTIHAAKGLEFPIVVLGDANFESRSGGGPLLDPELGILLPMKNDQKHSTMYERGKALEQDREDAEERRLLYVAATRAREMLLISGCVRLKKDSTPGYIGGWLKLLNKPLGLEKVKVPINESHDAVYRYEMKVEAVPVSCVFYRLEPPSAWEADLPEKRHEALSAPSLNFPLLEPVTPAEITVDTKTAQREGAPPQRVWRVVPQTERPRAPAWVVGSLVHDALAAWRFPDERFSAWAEARARSYGITDPRELADAVARSRQLLERFRTHPLFREMDQAERRFHEVPYSIVVDGQVESGVIDTLYYYEGRWTLVEFKTDEVWGEEELETLLKEEDYLPQIRRYILAVEILLGEKPRAFLCFLNYQGTIHLQAL